MKTAIRVGAILLSERRVAPFMPEKFNPMLHRIFLLSASVALAASAFAATPLYLDATGANWTTDSVWSSSSSGGSDTIWTAGDDAVFGVSTGNSSITLGGNIGVADILSNGANTPATLTVTGTAGSTLTLGSGTAGTGNISDIAGIGTGYAGSLTYTSANTTAGTFFQLASGSGTSATPTVWNIASGKTLAFNPLNGGDTVDLGGNTINLTGAGTVTLNNNNASAINVRNGTFNVNSGTLILSGGSTAFSTFQNSLAVNVATGGTLNLKPNSGNSSVTFAEAVTLAGGTLNNTNGSATQTGTVTIFATGTTTLTSTVTSGGGFTMANLTSSGGGGSGALKINGNTGVGNIVSNGTATLGTMTLTGGAGTKLTLGAGTAGSGNISDAAGTGTGYAGNLTYTSSDTANGTFFQLAANSGTSGTPTVWNIASGKALTFNGATGLTADTVDLGGNTVNLTGSVTFNKATVQNGTINLNSGTLLFNGGSSTNVNVAASVSVNVATGATLTVAANSGGGSTFNQATNLNGGTLQFNGGTNVTVATVNLLADSVINNSAGSGGPPVFTVASLSGAGNASFTRTGSVGAYSLTGTNAGYTGKTSLGGNVSLTLANTGALNVGTAGVTIASTASLLVNGTLNLTSGSATLSNSGTLTFASGSTINLGGFFDSYTNGQSYLLVTTGGTGVTDNGVQFTGYNGGLTVGLNGGNLTFTAVPEPSTYGLLGAGALAGFACIRRRRKLV